MARVPLMARDTIFWARYRSKWFTFSMRISQFKELSEMVERRLSERLLSGASNIRTYCCSRESETLQRKNEGVHWVVWEWQRRAHTVVNISNDLLCNRERFLFGLGSVLPRSAYRHFYPVCSGKNIFADRSFPLSGKKLPELLEPKQID
ncbi:hypothetical protein TNCV_4641241 [Trichonephila clavipes]|nr:hypothetical protein TNCV_4641241 [Trichonephila clavipes]